MDDKPNNLINDVCEFDRMKCEVLYFRPEMTKSRSSPGYQLLFYFMYGHPSVCKENLSAARSEKTPIAQRPYRLPHDDTTLPLTSQPAVCRFRNKLCDDVGGPQRIGELSTMVTDRAVPRLDAITTRAFPARIPFDLVGRTVGDIRSERWTCRTTAFGCRSCPGAS
jgi:hypothetical protein